MLNIRVRLVVTDLSGVGERILGEVASDQYSPEIVEKLVRECFNMALREMNEDRLTTLRKFEPEVSILLTADEDCSVRPSLHLGLDTLQLLTETGASFDFDPYI